MRSTPLSTCFAARCWRRLSAVSVPDNAQGEYYLTDIISVLARTPATRWRSLVAADQMETVRRQRSGHNWPWSKAELRRRINETLDATRRHDARPRPDLPRHHRRAWPLTSPSTPGPLLQGAMTVVEAGAEDRARHPAGRLHRRGPGSGGHGHRSDRQRLHRPRRPGRARGPGLPPGTHVPDGSVSGPGTAGGADLDGH